MTKKEKPAQTEVRELREFVQQIPEEARKAYERRCLRQDTLLGNLEKIEKFIHRNSLFPWLAFGCMLGGFLLSLSVGLSIGKGDIGVRKLVWVSVLPLIICSIPALVFSIKVEQPEVLWRLKEPILDLKEKLKQLGLKPEECTEEGFKRVLSNLAYSHILLEKSFDLVRPPYSSVSRMDLVRTFGLPIINSEENLCHTIGIVWQFGYEFDRAHLLKEEQNKIDLMNRATRSI